MPKGLFVSKSMPKDKKTESMEQRHVYSNEVPAMRPERLKKLSLHGIEDMSKCFPFSCHIYKAGDAKVIS